jgi:hypothetical protein
VVAEEVAEGGHIFNTGGEVMKGRRAGAVAIAGMAVILTCAVVNAATLSDFVNKAQGWINSLDDGDMTATINTYDGSETLMSSEALYFSDDSVNGWSMRRDITVYVPTLGSFVLKIIDTPSGQETFFDDECIYATTDYLVASWVDQPHSSLPDIFFIGDTGQSSLEALLAQTADTSVVETTLNEQSVYKLEFDVDLDEANTLFEEEADEFDTANDSVSGIIYILASDGTPVQSETALDVDGEQAQCKTVWSNVDTSPSIPAGTLDLTSSTPTMSFEEALADWVESKS